MILVQSLQLQFTIVLIMTFLLVSLFLQVPEGQSPLKTLVEIKQMFQRFSASPFVTLSPPNIKEGSQSFSCRLYSQKKNCSFTFSVPHNTTDRTDLGQESNLRTSNLKCKLNLTARDEEEVGGQVDDGETEDDFSDTKAYKARKCVRDLARQVVFEGDTKDELLYEAESPDEAALVHAAQAYHCTLKGRSAESLLVELPGIGCMAIQLLHILPFDSNRKRMSVVVRHPLTEQVVIYTKGADSVIMDLTETPKGKHV